MIYGSLSYACAMLEILAHANIGRIPTTHSYLIAEVPENIEVVRFDATSLPVDWDHDNPVSARRIGDQWLESTSSAILLVPSVVARLEWNALVNPRHPDANRLVVSASEKVVWDRRLFDRSSPG